jgi:hypothetical protein
MPYFDNWTYRIKIILPAAKVGSDVLNPVVPVKLDSDSLTNSYNNGLHDILGSGLTNRKKCAFTDSSGNYIYAEIKNWAAGCFYVATPTLNSVIDNIFYLYYSADAADSAYIGDAGDAAGQVVWTDGLSVYNCEQTPPTNVIDSKGSNDGAAFYNMDATNHVDSGFGKAYNFNGSDEYISCGTGNFGFSGNQQTVFVMFDADEAGVIFGKNGPVDFGFLLEYRDIEVNPFFSWNGSDFTFGWTGNPSFDKSDYVTMALVLDGAYRRVYYNGVEWTGAGYPYAHTAGGLYDSANEIRIADSVTFSNKFGGKINHIAVYNAAKSASWISVFNAGMFGTLLTFGSVESADTIRELIIDNIVSNLENITSANGYNTDAGNLVVRSREIGDISELPGIALNARPDEQADNKQYGYDTLIMPVDIIIADSYAFASGHKANKLAVSEKGEQILGDIRKAMGQTVALAEIVTYQNGGIEEYPLERENAFKVVVNATFNIQYETVKNDPYNQ